MNLLYIKNKSSRPARVIVFVLTLVLVSTFGLQESHAQLVVSNYNSLTQTNYINTATLGTDTLFIIYSPDNNGFEIEAQLRASLPGNPLVNFTWYRLNETTLQFDSLTQQTDVSQAELRTNIQGGYKVRLLSDVLSVDTSFVAWLFIEDFKITDIRVTQSTCKELELRADTLFERSFRYFDLVDFTPLTFTNSANLKWTADPAYTTVPSMAAPRIKAPVEPVTFTATLTDALNYSRSFSNTIDEYKTDRDAYPIIRAVKPNFKGIALSGSEGSSTAKDTTVRPEAPYGVWFVNDTKNGDLYRWHFYNHPLWQRDEADTLLAVSESYEPIDSIYYIHPAPVYNPESALGYKEGYDVKLFAWGPVYNANNDRCMDTIRKIDFVIVDTTQFPAKREMLPNVFNPMNTAGNNPNFYFLDKVLPVSVKYFSIKIYNRWGNKVYEYEDEDGSWTENGVQGWDGNTRFGGMAKPGVYYYVILAQGWDGREFKVPGYVHLFY